MNAPRPSRAHRARWIGTPLPEGWRSACATWQPTSLPEAGAFLPSTVRLRLDSGVIVLREGRRMDDSTLVGLVGPRSRARRATVPTADVQTVEAREPPAGAVVALVLGTVLLVMVGASTSGACYSC